MTNLLSTTNNKNQVVKVSPLWDKGGDEWVRRVRGSKGSEGYVILGFRVPPLLLGQGGYVILGFRVPTTCDHK